MPSRESALVELIVKAVKRRYMDAWAFKVVGSPYQMTGVPDLLFCINGLLVGCEVKHIKPGESVQHARERATQGQRVQIARINRAGGIAGVVTSPEEALDLIERGLKHRLGEKKDNGNEQDRG